MNIYFAISTTLSLIHAGSHTTAFEMVPLPSLSTLIAKAGHNLRGAFGAGDEQKSENGKNIINLFDEDDDEMENLEYEYGVMPESAQYNHESTFLYYYYDDDEERTNDYDDVYHHKQTKSANETVPEKSGETCNKMKACPEGQICQLSDDGEYHCIVNSTAAMY